VTLQPEQELEQAIDDTRRKLVVAVLVAGYSTGKTRSRGKREKQAVEITHQV